MPNLMGERKASSVLEGRLEIVGFDVMIQCVRAGADSDSWRERIPGCRSCDTKAACCSHVCACSLYICLPALLVLRWLLTVARSWCLQPALLS